MLNTDLHDPRLKSGKSSRKAMSVGAFISNLRGVDDGRDFPADFLAHMYAAIKQRAIEWKEAMPTAEETKGKKKKDERTPAQQDQDRFDASLRSSQQLRRLVEKRLQNSLLSSASSGWTVPSGGDAWLVAPLYDQTWFRALGIISILADQTAIEGCNNFCLDGLAYGTTIAFALGTCVESSRRMRKLVHRSIQFACSLSPCCSLFLSFALCQAVARRAMLSSLCWQS